MTRYTLALLIGLALSVCGQAFAQTPAFRSEVRSVRIDALISDKGVPVTGLSADDLEVIDSGVRQQIDYVGADTAAINLVLLFDMSRSIEASLLAQLRAAGQTALRTLREGDRVALLTFSDAVTVVAPLSTDVGRVDAAISTLSPSGGTSLNDALYAALALEPSDDSRTLIVVFSDGLDTGSWLQPQQILRAATFRASVVFAVTSASIRNPLLDDLTAATGGRVFRVSSHGQLPATFADILSEFRQRYVIGYVPRRVPADGFHPLTVRVRNRDFTVKARSGYMH